MCTDTKTKPSSKQKKRPADKSTLPGAKKQKVASKGSHGATENGALSEAKKQKVANKENLMAAKTEVCVHVYL